MTPIFVCLAITAIGLLAFLITMVATREAPGAFVFAVMTIFGLIGTLISMFVAASNGKL